MPIGPAMRGRVSATGSNWPPRGPVRTACRRTASPWLMISKPSIPKAGRGARKPKAQPKAQPKSKGRAKAKAAAADSSDGEEEAAADGDDEREEEAMEEEAIEEAAEEEAPPTGSNGRFALRIRPPAY